jgi:hypothetical protein
MSSERNLQDGFFCMGNETLAVPLALFAENRWDIMVSPSAVWQHRRSYCGGHNSARVSVVDPNQVRPDPELFPVADPEYILDPK